MSTTSLIALAVVFAGLVAWVVVRQRAASRRAEQLAETDRPTEPIDV